MFYVYLSLGSKIKAMLKDNVVRKKLSIGYTFMYRGEHCTIIRFYKKGFMYSTLEKPARNFMHYKFFQSIPHFKSAHEWKYSSQKSLDFNPGFLPLVQKITENIRKGKSPNQKIYIN